MKKSFFILLCYLVTLPVFAQNTILVLGDSLSAGYGIEVQQGWVSLLKQRLEDRGYDYQVVNASISGDTTSAGLARLPTALKQHRPHITIIELGGNDGLRGLPMMVISKNLQKMITLAQEANSKVLLIGVRMPPNYGPTYTQQFQKLFTQLAEENDIAVVPLFLSSIDDNPDLMQADGVHPSSKAQAVMLDNIWPILEKLLQ